MSTKIDVFQISVNSVLLTSLFESGEWFCLMCKVEYCGTDLDALFPDCTALLPAVLCCDDDLIVGQACVTPLLFVRVCFFYSSCGLVRLCADLSSHFVEREGEFPVPHSCVNRIVLN